MTADTSKPGLQDVIATDTQISGIDGAAGELIYRGYDIHELAGRICFEEACWLLWTGELPTAAELEDLTQRLTAARELPPGTTELLESIPRETPPMEALRTVVSWLGHHDRESDDTAEKRLSRSIRLVARVASAVAALGRVRDGQPPVAPEASLSHAGNFLYMLSGQRPSEQAERVLDTALVLHAEHGFNASTFSARVTVATLSDLYSGATSAVGTLKGPLHGGANERVMATLEKIGSLDRVESYVRDALARKERFMGFGHRVYRTVDPRATHLKRYAEALATEAGMRELYEMSARMEALIKEEKGLDANVDFYSATTYRALGIPTELFTPVFAVGRMPGWTAHMMEQLDDNRLIRPRARYVGPRDKKLTALDER